jgi:glycosyltransferase involved in cell wall biosynthesis
MISIITASYNNASTIQQSIDSLSSQTFKDIEYIIIDGSSTDGTQQILHSNSSQITKFISESDSGIYDALNKGLALATGDIIGFLHADDSYASPHILEKVAAAFTENPSIWAVYGDLQFVSQNDTTKVIRSWKSRSFNPSLISKGWMPAHPTLFLRKEVYEKYGRFNTSYRIAADYDLILRIFSQPSFSALYLPETFIKMRMGGASTGSLKNLIQKSKEDYLILKRNKVGNIFTLFLKIASKFSQFYQKS